ncbi:hypothetical protein [Geotalea toluenoxydans]|uniref:hypothetical protein n=1 Tax=Geotalea toluenoxydans TaxID=421624 RepID=UPI000AA9B890|nr:hypothetical protein [Geotalea toluenoxydans]
MAAAMEAQGALNGKTLLESRCTSCHEVKTVIAMKKTRRQWHGVIVDMRRTGAKVSDAEATASQLPFETGEIDQVEVVAGGSVPALPAITSQCRNVFSRSRMLFPPCASAFPPPAIVH